MSNYNQNQVLAKILFEHIKSSHEGNGMFELDINESEKSFIDKSKGMIVGLHTDWGGGKTTLIETLTDYLGKDDYFVENINAWQFNKEKKEDLWMSIISYFYIKIVEKYKGELKDDKDLKSLIGKLTLSNLASITNKLTGIVMPKVSFLTKWLEDFTKEIEGNDPTKGLDGIKDNISLFYSMQEDIINILENEKIINKVKKYVLIIDDLDRCSPKEVVNLLDALKLFLNIPNLIVIVAVDRRHIEKGIYEVYNKGNDSKFIVNPDEYLEKIIHLPVDLFLFDEDIRKELEYNEIKKDEKAFDDKFSENIRKILKDKDIQKIIDLGLSNNPRKNLRFKRLFKFYYGLFNSKYIGFFNDSISFFNQEKEIVEIFFTFWLILKMEWGDYFQEIIKSPILLYLPYKNEYSDKEKIDQILNYYSKVFYSEVDFNKLNNYESTKLKKFIFFINSFAEEENIGTEFTNVIKYFYSFHLGKSLNSDNKGDKLLIKPIIELELFKTDEDFKIRYKNLLLKNIYNYNLDTTILGFTDFENNILKKIFTDFSQNTNKDKDNLEKRKNSKSNEKRKTINSELLVKMFEENEKVNYDSNIKILDNAYHNHVKMIMGINSINNVKEIDPKRFIIGSKLFFDLVTIEKNLIELSKIEIDENSNLNKEKGFITVVSNNQINYNILGEDHILNKLNNNERRSLFGELINQISFAKDGPSIGGMTGATDYTQLEAIVIEGIKGDKLDEWNKILKNAIIVNKEIKSTEEQINKYIVILDFIRNNLKEENLIRKFNRLEKRLIYIFSHFWSLQNINLFIPYYGTTKEGLTLLGKWKQNDISYTNIFQPYISFCNSFNLYLNDYIDTLGNNFINELDVYFNENFTNELETIFLGNKIKIDKEYAKKFIKVKIIEHRLIRLLEFKEQQEEGNNQDTN